MSSTLLIIGVAVSGLAFVLAQRLDLGRVAVATKPVPILLLLAGLFLCGEPRNADSRLLIAAGLLACAVGDLMLVLPGDHFLGGLVAFLVGHLLYVAAFLTGTSAPARLQAAGVAVGYVVVAGVIYAVLYSHLDRLRVPVAFYVAAICAMCAAAWARGLSDGSWLAPAGATLFFLSDGVLAVDHFRYPFRAAKPLLYVLYAAGQVCITASAWTPRG